MYHSKNCPHHRANQPGPSLAQYPVSAAQYPASSITADERANDVTEAQEPTDERLTEGSAGGDEPSSAVAAEEGLAQKDGSDELAAEGLRGLTDEGLADLCECSRDNAQVTSQASTSLSTDIRSDMQFEGSAGPGDGSTSGADAVTSGTAAATSGADDAASEADVVAAASGVSDAACGSGAPDGDDGSADDELDAGAKIVRFSDDDVGADDAAKTPSIAERRRADHPHRYDSSHDQGIAFLERLESTTAAPPRKADASSTPPVGKKAESAGLFNQLTFSPNFSSFVDFSSGLFSTAREERCKVRDISEVEIRDTPPEVKELTSSLDRNDGEWATTASAGMGYLQFRWKMRRRAETPTIANLGVIC